jgi:hypothetical protein
MRIPEDSTAASQFLSLVDKQDPERGVIDPSAIVVSKDRSYAIVGGDRGAYRFNMKTNTTDHKIAPIQEVTSLHFSTDPNQVYSISDDSGVVFRIDNVTNWENSTVVKAAENPLLRLSKRGQIAYDPISGNIFATNKLCDCILKVENISTSPVVSKFAQGPLVDKPVSFSH